MDNEQIMKVKMTEEQIKKQEADLKFQEMKNKIEETKNLEMMKRMSEQDNKRQYQNILNQQVKYTSESDWINIQMNRCKSECIQKNMRMN